MSIPRNLFTYKYPSSFSAIRYVLNVFAVLVTFVATAIAAQAVPTLSLSAPATAYVDEVVLIDARLSTGISKSPQGNGSPSVVIDFGDGFSANMLATGHAYRTAGTYTITLTGKDSSGATARRQLKLLCGIFPQRRA